VSEQDFREVARAAADRIRDPDHWCRLDFAKDSDGNSVPAWSPEAVRWCAMGAVLAEFRKGGESLMRAREPDAWGPLSREFHSRTGLGLMGANDLKGHDYMVEALDAIAAG